MLVVHALIYYRTFKHNLGRLLVACEHIKKKKKKNVQHEMHYMHAIYYWTIRERLTNTGLVRTTFLGQGWGREGDVGVVIWFSLLYSLWEKVEMGWGKEAGFGTVGLGREEGIRRCCLKILFFTMSTCESSNSCWLLPWAMLNKISPSCSIQEFGFEGSLILPWDRCV